MKRAAIVVVVISVVLTSCSHAAKPSATARTASLPSILVFTRTRGFHHSSIPAAIAAIKQLGQRNGFAVDASADPSLFTDARLARYKAVVFLLTTGDVLDDEQQAVFQRYIEHDGGFVGVHSATDTEYGWPWYGELVGAFFKNHPKIQRASVLVRDRTLAATAALPGRWVRTDEWYNFRTDSTPHVHVLLTVDEATYTGGTMGAGHPIAWCHDFDGGRAWYTAMGHSSSAYSEPMFLSHLLRGILYASKLESTGCPPPQV